jgi:hypothetical protein
MRLMHDGHGLHRTFHSISPVTDQPFITIRMKKERRSRTSVAGSGISVKICFMWIAIDGKG